MISLAGELGFEPRLTESESAVLPLNYSPQLARSINSLRKRFCKSRVRFCKFGTLRADICGQLVLCPASSALDQL
jgi:hypothetical protein